MKKVYFSASISGGRQDVSIYSYIVEKLKEQYEVLTEHVSSKKLTGQEKSLTPEQVYTRDISLLDESDFIVCEASTPSLGVGYELAYAENKKKKVYVLHNISAEKPLSFMIKGDHYFDIYPYHDQASLESQLLKIIENEQ